MSAQRPAPTILVEAGGEPWSRVEPLLDRRTEEIAGPAVIEVVTADPGVRTALRGWCRRRGAVLEATASGRGYTAFRIRVESSLPHAEHGRTTRGSIPATPAAGRAGTGEQHR